jgi:hypothetical protein
MPATGPGTPPAAAGKDRRWIGPCSSRCAPTARASLARQGEVRDSRHVLRDDRDAGPARRGDRDAGALPPAARRARMGLGRRPHRALPLAALLGVRAGVRRVHGRRRLAEGGPLRDRRPPSGRRRAGPDRSGREAPRRRRARPYRDRGPLDRPRRGGRLGRGCRPHPGRRRPRGPRGSAGRRGRDGRGRRWRSGAHRHVRCRDARGPGRGPHRPSGGAAARRSSLRAVVGDRRQRRGLVPRGCAGQVGRPTVRSSTATT